MFDFPVFSEDVASKKRGTGAEEMLRCDRCGESRSVFLNVRNKMPFNGKSGSKMFTSIVWEHWHCLNCGLHWTAKYGVSANGVGTIQQLLERNEL